MRGRLDYGEPSCIAFGGLRVDDVVEAALLSVVQPAAVEAARAAEAQTTAQRDEAREALVRDLEAARYAADRAFRQYDAADPENRLVAGELEARSDHDAVSTYLGAVVSWVSGDLDRRLPGSEDGHEFFARFDAAVAGAVASGHETVAVVSHGAAIRGWCGSRSHGSAEFVAQHPLEERWTPSSAPRPAPS